VEITTKEVEIEFTLKTKVKIYFVNDEGDDVTPPYFDAKVVYHDFKDITKQIQEHVNECGVDYYEDNK
jgi:hypothetical protein